MTSLTHVVAPPPGERPSEHTDRGPKIESGLRKFDGHEQAQQAESALPSTPQVSTGDGDAATTLSIMWNLGVVQVQNARRRLGESRPRGFLLLWIVVVGSQASQLSSIGAKSR